MSTPALPRRIRIVATCLGAVAACAEAGSPVVPQPAPSGFVDQFEKNGGVFPGYRRNHAKGVCVVGHFDSSGAAAPYSAAQVFMPGRRSPVVGRFSIPGTNPYAWDDSTPIRGMALQFTQADGRQWRTAMNAVAAFPVATPLANYEFMQAQQPDPATGDPDPKRLAAFLAGHPTADAFRLWNEGARPSASYAVERYNSLDSFVLVDARGGRHPVRWRMVPTAGADARPVPAGDPDFLAADLRSRLSHGPLRWHLEIVFPEPDDAIDNAARAWPQDRRHIDAGTLVIRSSRPHGTCDAINFDPLVLPAGIEPSDDPLLRLRSAVYAQSHQLRGCERRARRPCSHRAPIPYAKP